MSYTHLTKTEEKLMLFLWDQDRPMSVAEILESWNQKAWTKNYIRDIVRSLEQKGAVEFSGLDHRGSKYARRFRAAVSREEYYAGLTRENGVSLAGLFREEVTALAQRGERREMDELIRELEGIIEEYRSGGGE